MGLDLRLLPDVWRGCEDPSSLMPQKGMKSQLGRAIGKTSLPRQGAPGGSSRLGAGEGSGRRPGCEDTLTDTLTDTLRDTEAGRKGSPREEEGLREIRGMRQSQTWTHLEKSRRKDREAKRQRKRASVAGAERQRWRRCRAERERGIKSP